MNVQYFRYWCAIERMIEFVIEIRVMALFLKSASYDLPGDIAEKIHQTRSELFGGDIKIDADLPNLVASATFLRHQAALCQSLSHPLLWGRGEFVVEKANYLLDQQIRRLEKDFLKDGGLRERMTRARLESRKQK